LASSAPSGGVATARGHQDAGRASSWPAVCSFGQHNRTSSLGWHQGRVFGPGLECQPRLRAQAARNRTRRVPGEAPSFPILRRRLAVGEVQARHGEWRNFGDVRRWAWPGTRASPSGPVVLRCYGACGNPTTLALAPAASTTAGSKASAEVLPQESQILGAATGASASSCRNHRLGDESASTFVSTSVASEGGGDRSAASASTAVESRSRRRPRRCTSVHGLRGVPKPRGVVLRIRSFGGEPGW